MMWRAKNDRRTEALWHQEALHYENVNFNLAPVDHIDAAAEQNSSSAERNSSANTSGGSSNNTVLWAFRKCSKHAST